MKVFLIPADPREPMQELDAPRDDAPDGGFAKWCNEKVGGYLEVVALRAFQRSGIMMWVCEDAKREQFPPNIRATRVALLAPRDFIAGEVVITGSKGPETDDAPIDFATWKDIVEGFMSVPQPAKVEE